MLALSPIEYAIKQNIPNAKSNKMQKLIMNILFCIFDGLIWHDVSHIKEPEMVKGLQKQANSTIAPVQHAVKKIELKMEAENINEHEIMAMPAHHTIR